MSFNQLKVYGLLCVLSPLWQKHQNGVKYRQLGIGLRWCWTADSRVLPYSLSKLLTSVLSFASFSNFMTQAQHAVEEDLLLQHGPSQDTVELSPLIRFCNSKDKPVKLPLITHPQLEPL